MAGLEQSIRRWLRESKLETTDEDVSGTSFAIGFKFPSGLKLTAIQPDDRGDMVIVTCALNIDPENRSKIKGSRGKEFVWNLRRDLLLSKLAFAFLPADEEVPEMVAVSSDLYQDGLSKTAFMRAAQDVHSGAVLVITTTRRYVDESST